MPFEFRPAPIEGLIVVQPRMFGDERGFFMESYKRSEFEAAGVSVDFRQDNHSRSGRGVLRGLHYQLPPHGQGKLVRVTRGRAWDVAVDIRQGSPSFGQWYGLELNAENRTMFWIPEGFAHGFVALEDDTEFLYKTTGEYDQPSEGGIRYDDPQLAIDWPLPAAELKVSDKDLVLPGLAECRNTFVYGRN